MASSLSRGIPSNPWAPWEYVSFFYIHVKRHAKSDPTVCFGLELPFSQRHSQVPVPTSMRDASVNANSAHICSTCKLGAQTVSLPWLPAAGFLLPALGRPAAAGLASCFRLFELPGESCGWLPASGPGRAPAASLASGFRRINPPESLHSQPFYTCLPGRSQIYSLDPPLTLVAM